MSRSGPTVSFECSCGAALEVACATATPAELRCGSCGATHSLHPERRDGGGGLRGCLACGHPELYTVKDFPRGLGIGIVVVAAVLAPFTWYASLVVAALLDLGLYWLLPPVVRCYVCDAAHRGFPATPRHPRYDREIAERLRYGDKAVMGRPMRPGGTADAPEPEH